MKMGGGNAPVPFYVRPGDTLDITVKGMLEKDVTVDYVSSHPRGCYENLLKHQTCRSSITDGNVCRIMDGTWTLNIF